MIRTQNSPENAYEQKHELKHPEWSKNANIYEVNIRQYTKEGTLKAFQKHLPRLQEMGVKILWLMPVYPIGKKNRKGPMGSYYAVKNYKAVNPNVGTFNDVQALVDEAHQRGMKVILDWVANHTAWDHVWTETHPEWYTKDKEGKFKAPVKDWSDVIELDYANLSLREAMTDALAYWVKKADVDGFRCDVADLVPTDFWNEVRKQLDEIKPIFMLAESDHAELQQRAFDMTYDFKLYYIMNAISKGNSTLHDIDGHMKHEQQTFAANDYRMVFTSNHDENSWDGTVKERLRKNVKAFAVLAATSHGMPLIYGGQEARLDKRLKFFEKDTISWDELPLKNFYTKLLKLKADNKALWNGEAGGDYKKIETSEPKSVYAFKRSKDDRIVVVVINISDKPKKIALSENGSRFVNVFTDKKIVLDGTPIEILPHGYLVLQK